MKPVPRMMDQSLLSLQANFDTDQIEAWTERAAIMEYDGQVPREEAEWLALETLRQSK